MKIGNPFIVLDLETGDCKRFNNIQELRKEFNITQIGSLIETLKLPKIKDKYKFFAYESDLLKYEI